MADKHWFGMIGMAVMAEDLAGVSRTELQVQLCGDARLGNFRWYKAPDRTPVFDLNDFDETLPGPFDSDLCCRRGNLSTGTVVETAVGPQWSGAE